MECFCQFRLGDRFGWLRFSLWFYWSLRLRRGDLHRLRLRVVRSVYFIQDFCFIIVIGLYLIISEIGWVGPLLL